MVSNCCSCLSDSRPGHVRCAVYYNDCWIKCSAGAQYESPFSFYSLDSLKKGIIFRGLEHCRAVLAAALIAVLIITRDP